MVPDHLVLEQEFLFFSLRNPQPLEQCLAHSRYTVTTICAKWMDGWING